MNDTVAGLIVFVVLLAILGVLALAVRVEHREKHRKEEEKFRRIVVGRYGGEEKDDGKQ